jgi:hypothetical protein
VLPTLEVALPIVVFKILVGRPIYADELSYITGMEKERLRKITRGLSALLFLPSGLVVCQDRKLLRGTKMVGKDLRHGRVRVVVPKKRGRPGKNAGKPTKGGMPSSYDLSVDQTKFLKLTEKKIEELRGLISSPYSSALKNWCESSFHLIEYLLSLVIEGVELWLKFCYKELREIYSRLLEVVDCISPELKAKAEVMLFPILSTIEDTLADPQAIQEIKNAVSTTWSEWMDEMNKLNEKQYLEKALLSTCEEEKKLASRLDFHFSQMPRAFKANGSA